MRHTAILLMAWGAVFTSCCTTRCGDTCKGTAVLAAGGRTDYRIVVPANAAAPVKYAAEELAFHLKEMTGAEFPVVTDAEAGSPHEIILGDNARLRDLGIAIDLGKLGEEGYVIRTVGDRLAIAGGEPRGTLYGVYGLLEDHFGCRWFTPAVSRIPKIAKPALPQIDETTVPVLEYREPFTIDCFDGTWCARNRMNSSAGRLEEKHGGKVRFGAGMFVHTFAYLVPLEKYWDTHPEYFSEINGQRVKDYTQLCCTNPEVVRICIESVKEKIKADPEAYVYSVSQNDWGNYCQCANCQALATAEESQMAPVLQLVNQVAEAIEKDFPDKAIETLAYQWTRKPPRTMRPRPNVIVRLCSIECCFMHPLATCDSRANAEFRKDAEGWAKIGNRLWVWDYVTSFRHFLTPFPNQRVLNDNIRFFVKNNVKGIFEQDNYMSLNGELSPLGGYMMAKFLWNPDYCEETAMMEFLDGVYGPKAAKYIRRYIDLLNDKVADDNIHANIWIGPQNSKFLTPDVMRKAEKFWNWAEWAVADEPTLLERVQTLRLCEDYAWVELNKDRVYEFDQKTCMVRPDPELVQRVRTFIEHARRADVTRLAEAPTPFEEYAKQFEDILNKPPEKLEPAKPVAVTETAPGLEVVWYVGNWDRIPDMAGLTPAGNTVAKTIRLDCIPREESFAARYTGYFRAPKTGLYGFQLTSNDGSRMQIGGITIDNDGLHDSDTKDRVVALRKGYHPLEILYFQAGGGKDLSVVVRGPGLKQGPVPPCCLWH